MIAALGAVATAVVLALGGADGGTAPSAAEPSPTAPTAANARAAVRGEHALAMARLRAGNFAEAAELFARAAAREPENAALATDLGFALGRVGRRTEAEAVLRGAIEKDPHRYYAYVNLADLLAEDPARWERWDAVVAFLDKGLDALKDDGKGRFNLLLGLAGFERSVGRTAAARGRLHPLLGTEAPPLSRAQRKRVLDLLDAIALDERARALEDWPAPTLTRADQDRELTVIGLVDEKPDQALVIADALCADHPDSAGLRVIRAQTLETLGRLDEAARDLEIAVNLAPSNARAWRALGGLLAAHGGALELDRADEALRQALTLEPAWADLRELRTQIARRRAAVVSAPAPRTVVPSEHARALYQQAQEWLDVGDPIGMGRDLVEEALGDSPGFVAAALSLYALAGTVPQETIDALHEDGPGLWTLAAGVRKLGKGGSQAPETDALVGPWIDRAVDLDVQEARFARATSRAAAGNRAGALADLVAYVAREPNPEHLAEARALRAGLGEGADSRGTANGSRDARLSPQLLARIRLLEDRPDAALRALGGSCVVGLPGERLVEIGLVEEYLDRRGAARACYELAAGAENAGDRPLARLSRLDARLPDAELRAADRRPLARAAAGNNAAATWTMARLSAMDGNQDAARAQAERALRLADHDGSGGTDVWIPAARAAQKQWSEAWSADMLIVAGRSSGQRRLR